MFRVMYVNDPLGFSIEMLNARKALWSLSGFNPGEPYVQVEALIRAPADRVWSRLIDHAGLSSWTPFEGRIVRPGADSPNGPGCLREVTLPGVRIIEEVLTWDEGRHYRYTLRSGAPLRWHQGDLFIREEGGATRVRLAIRFESRIPLTGGIIAWAVGRVYGRALNVLKRQLEQ